MLEASIYAKDLTKAVEALFRTKFPCWATLSSAVILHDVVEATVFDAESSMAEELVSTSNRCSSIKHVSTNEDEFHLSLMQHGIVETYDQSEFSELADDSLNSYTFSIPEIAQILEESGSIIISNPKDCVRIVEIISEYETGVSNMKYSSPHYTPPPADDMEKIHDILTRVKPISDQYMGYSTSGSLFNQLLSLANPQASYDPTTDKPSDANPGIRLDSFNNLAEIYTGRSSFYAT